MDLRAQYTEARSDGIFGWTLPADIPPESEVKPLNVFVTHAYRQADGTYRPITRAGTYDCERGIHYLQKEGGPLVEIETFEILGIDGHKGILFGHWGNFGSSSKGCFCFGRKIVRIDQDRDGLDGPDEMVTESRAAYGQFMAAQEGVNRFRLIVEELYATTGGAA